jgi:hypothetical protein
MVSEFALFIKDLNEKKGINNIWSRSGKGRRPGQTGSLKQYAPFLLPLVVFLRRGRYE